jgi:hypothetical protein
MQVSASNLSPGTLQGLKHPIFDSYFLILHLSIVKILTDIFFWKRSQSYARVNFLVQQGYVIF